MSLKPKSLNAQIVIPSLAAIFISFILIFAIVTYHVRTTTASLKDAFLSIKTRAIFTLCERNYGELLISGNVWQHKAVEAKKRVAISEIENFLISEGIEGIVTEKGRVVFSTLKIEVAPVFNRDAGSIKIKTDKGVYYGYYVKFSPWQWGIATFIPEGRYWETQRNAYVVLGATFFIFLLLIALIYLIVKQGLHKPIVKILKSLKNTGNVSFRPGSEELDTLVDTINKTMSSLEENRKRLEESETRLSNVLRYSTEFAIAATDLDFRIILYNPKAEMLFGHTADEVIGRTVMEMHTKEKVAPERFDRAVDIVTREGKYEYVVESVDKDGNKRFVNSIVTAMRDAKNVHCGYVLISRDVTEKNKLEEQLRQSQKMESIGLLAGGIAHDFNNILTGIIGYADLAINRMAADDPLYEYIKEVSESAERAASLTHQLLAFSRKQVLKPQIINLNDTVMKMDKMLRRIIGEHIIFKTHLSDNICLVKADPAQIEQVIMNLSLNARESMPSGGSLEIETYNLITNEGYARIHGIISGEYVVMSISDTGGGIRNEIKEHIFEPFFTTKEKGKGTGLGLSIVYGIVKQHNGHIEMQSEIGKGTTFRVYLPVTREDSAPKKEKGKPTLRQIHKGAGSILVVEDEAHVRSLVTEILKMSGYTVKEAKNGIEALSIVKEGKTDFDLIVTDVIMPEMGGIELSAALKKMDPAVKVLFMSGYTDDMITPEVVSDKEKYLIAKPFSPDDFIKKVKKIL
ncbi:MAG: response regulator [Nitrospirae bacterium]|nr:response regulator [Nitrospirota bacterium]